ncbi:hypothetical protein ZYGNAAKF_CDS0190 [Enterococcus phage VRE9_2]
MKACEIVNKFAVFGRKFYHKIRSMSRKKSKFFLKV